MTPLLSNTDVVFRKLLPQQTSYDSPDPESATKRYTLNIGACFKFSTDPGMDNACSIHSLEKLNSHRTPTSIESVYETNNFFTLQVQNLKDEIEKSCRNYQEGNPEYSLEEIRDMVVFEIFYSPDCDKDDELHASCSPFEHAHSSFYVEEPNTTPAKKILRQAIFNIVKIDKPLLAYSSVKTIH